MIEPLLSRPLSIHTDADLLEIGRRVAERTGAALAESMTADQGPTTLKVLITATTPPNPLTDRPTVFYVGTPDAALDEWDRDTDSESVSACVLVGEAKPTEQSAAISAWLAVKADTATAALFGLTDEDGRDLKWSTIAAKTVNLPPPANTTHTEPVDDVDLQAFMDGHPAAIGLAQAVERLGGESAQTVLARQQELRSALLDINTVAADLSAHITDEVGPVHHTGTVSRTPVGDSDLRELDSALAEHLALVQRTGIARWRSGRQRAATQQAWQKSGRDLAAARLHLILRDAEGQLERARANRQAAQASAAASRQLDAWTTAVSSQIKDAVFTIQPWQSVVADRVRTSWGRGLPAPRVYILIPEEHSAALTEALSENGIGTLTARSHPFEQDCVTVLLVQSGFCLPAAL